MAPSDRPETTPAHVEGSATTGIQAAPDLPSSVETPSIPLPPMPRRPAMDEAKFLKLRAWLDAVLVVLVVLFAFLVASFPVANPDFFRQLAIGRLLVEGGYHFGVDPFIFTADGEYWVNHSWLFALLVYGIYQIPAIGGAAVVIVKALLIAALAAILLRAGRRAGQSLWIPASCTALAILAISPRLYLQSACLSFVFLGLTVWLLTAVGSRRTAASDKRLWLLPPLFALWVNCDQWFFLGPLTLALYLAGEMLQHWLPSDESEANDARQQRVLWMLGAVLGVGVLACLVNPHHLHALQLPAEFGFSSANDLIESDPQFRSLFLTPLTKTYYEPYLGLSIAGLAYWPLLAVGLASFVFVFTRVAWWRLLVWLCFALLSLYNVRAIPFFAIVAAPITALNWLDYAAHRLGTAPRLTRDWRNGSLGGRAVTILAALLLSIATLPGWLQAEPHDYRRVSWSVRVDPSLEAMARTIQEWRRAERLPDEPHWFNMHHEIANYMAWFAPGERVFLDQALPRYRETANDYLSIREGLEQSVRAANASGEEIPAEDRLTLKRDWRALLRKQKVHFWIFDHSNMRKADVAAQQMLFSDPDEWLLCYLHGRIAIFAWRDPKDAKSADFAKLIERNLKDVAFGAKAEQAPQRGPELAAAPRESWDAWWQAKPAMSPERDTAMLYDLRFLALQQRYLHANSRAWQGAVETSAIGLALPCGPMPNSLLALNWSITYNDLFPPGATRMARKPLESEAAAMQAWSMYVSSQDAGPPECLYLSIRAARRALLANAEDARSYLLLGQAYLRLNELTQERFLKTLAPRLADVRQTQLVAALQNCLLLKPEDSLALEAHQTLFEVFRQSGYLDAAAYHLREVLELRKKLEAKAGTPPEDTANPLKDITAFLNRLEREVKRRQDEYDVTAATKPVLEKVGIALEKGLAETALSTLNQATAADFSGQNLEIVRKMMELSLNLGRLKEARELLIPEPEKTTGQPVKPEYVDLHLRLAAASGDSEDADRSLADALSYAWKDANGNSINTINRVQIATMIGRVFWAEGQHLMGVPRLPWVPKTAKAMFDNPWLGQSPSDFWLRRWRLDGLKMAIFLQEERCNWYLMRGWLALEAGRCVEARKHFQAAGNEQVAETNWIPEVNRLQAMIEVKGQRPEERIKLEEFRIRQNFTRNVIRYYLHWLKPEK
jgi:hypothetical protein